MIDLKVYSIRKAILRDMKSAGGAPLTAKDLHEYSPNQFIRSISLQYVQEQWIELKSHGYLAAIPGFEGEYCRITERGLRQLDMDATQDTFVHGPGAAQ